MFLSNKILVVSMSSPNILGHILCVHVEKIWLFIIVLLWSFDPSCKWMNRKTTECWLEFSFSAKSLTVKDYSAPWSHRVSTKESWIGSWVQLSHLSQNKNSSDGKDEINHYPLYSWMDRRKTLSTLFAVFSPQRTHPPPRENMLTFLVTHSWLPTLWLTVWPHLAWSWAFTQGTSLFPLLFAPAKKLDTTKFNN